MKTSTAKQRLSLIGAITAASIINLGCATNAQTGAGLGATLACALAAANAQRGKAAEECVKYAVVGGIAVSFRSVVRTTNDLDLAVVVNNDAEAESIVRTLIGLGYRAEVLLESDVSGRLATVRMISAGEREVFVDLLFASSGIEGEVVASSNPIEGIKYFV